MRPFPRFWRALEDTAGAAAWAEWKYRLGDDLPSALPMLSPADRFVESLSDWAAPCRWYRVVQHGPGDFVGVPEDGGPALTLRREDVLVHRIDHRKLGRRLAEAFALEFRLAPLAPPRCAWRIGMGKATGGTPIDFSLLVPTEEGDLEQAIAWHAAGRSPYVLLLPTRRRVTPEAERLIRQSSGHLVVLAEAIVSDGGKRWTAAAEAQVAVKRHLETAANCPDEPLSERAQLVLAAMLELDAVDSDRRRSVEEIAPRALGPQADANALKLVLAELRAKGMTRSKTGRGGGFWLTDKGQRRAERLAETR
ncbi:hypothetical protein [Thermopirellula anaerolimosa]|jgi:hypothetical protein